MRNASIRHVGITLGLSFFLGLAPIARAQEASPEATNEAKAQYRQGTEAFSAKRYAEAALHFESAAAIRPHAVTLFTAALAWDSAGRPERAADAFSRSLDLPGLDAKQTQTAKERVQSLEKTLGVVVVTVPAGWKIQLDSLTEVNGSARLHAPPGAHVLTVRPVGYPIERRDVALDAGKVVSVEIDEAQLAAAKKAAEPQPPPTKVEEPPPAPPVQPPPPPPASALPLKPVGFVLAGTGGAMLLGGIVLGLQANGARDAYNAGPTREAYDHANGLATWSTVAFVSGIVVAAAGVTLVLLPLGKTEAKVALSPTSVALGGTFE